MKELNTIISARNEDTDPVIKAVGIKFMTPQEALDAGLGNLFDSRDNSNKKYPIAIALGPDQKAVKGAIVDVDQDRFYSDTEYKFQTMRLISDLFVPPINKI